MEGARCPGQDLRRWKPEDIAWQACPGCGQEIEIWKDEPERACRACGCQVRNARLDLACAQWCGNGKACLARLQGGSAGMPPART